MSNQLVSLDIYHMFYKTIEQTMKELIKTRNRLNIFYQADNIFYENGQLKKQLEFDPTPCETKQFNEYLEFTPNSNCLIFWNNVYSSSDFLPSSEMIKILQNKNKDGSRLYKYIFIVENKEFGDMYNDLIDQYYCIKFIRCEGKVRTYYDYQIVERDKQNVEE